MKVYDSNIDITCASSGELHVMSRILLYNVGIIV